MITIDDNVPLAPKGGEYRLKCVNGHDRCYLGTDDACQYCERVPIGKAASDFALGVAAARACKPRYSQYEIQSYLATNKPGNAYERGWHHGLATECGQ